MDWQAWEVVLWSMGGNALLLAAAAFLAKKWIGVRIEESVKHEYAKKLKNLTDERDSDTRLLKEFIAVLPPEGSIAFISGYDVGAFPFQRGKLRDLWEFDREWGDVTHEFLDTEIDALRKQLRSSVSRYLSMTQSFFFSRSNNPDLIEIPREWDNGEENDRFHTTLKQLNDVADEVERAYRELVRTARRKLRC